MIQTVIKTALAVGAGVVNGVKNGLPILSNLPKLEIPEGATKTALLTELAISIITSLMLFYLLVKVVKGEIDLETFETLVKAIE